MFPGVDVIRGDVADALVIAAVVVVFNECPDCLLQLTRHLVGEEIDASLHGVVVPLNLAIGLRVKGRGQNVPYAYQPQVLTKLPREIPRAIVREQHYPILQGDVCHASCIHRLLDDVEDPAAISLFSSQARISRLKSSITVTR